MSWFKRKPKRVPIELSLGVRASYNVNLRENLTWDAVVSYEAVVREPGAPFEPWLDVYSGEWYSMPSWSSYHWTDAEYIQVTWGDKKTKIYGIDNEVLKVWDAFLEEFRPVIPTTFTTPQEAAEELVKLAIIEFDKRYQFWEDLNTVFVHGDSQPITLTRITAEVDER